MKGQTHYKISALKLSAVLLTASVFLTACSEPESTVSTQSSDNKNSVNSEEKLPVAKTEDVLTAQKSAPVAVVIEEKSIQSASQAPAKSDIKQKLKEVQQVVVDSTAKVVDVTKEASKDILVKSTEVAKELGGEAVTQLKEVTNDATSVAKEAAQKSLVEVDKATSVVTQVVTQAIENVDGDKVKEAIDRSAQAAKVVSEKALNKVQELLPKN